MPSDAQATGNPALPDAVEEVQAIFRSQDQLEAAMNRLNADGFDRADFSLPNTNPATHEATPNLGAENPTTQEDRTQLRTMGASMAAASAAIVGAGVVIATGGLLAPAVAVAAGAGLAAGGVVEGAHHASDAVQRDGRDEKAIAGELVLAIRLKDPGRLPQVETVLGECGAIRIERVVRDGADLRAADAGVSSASWTG